MENQFLQLKTGQDFVNVLYKEIQNYNEKDAFGLVGVFGTKEIGHDIDVMFYPSDDRPKGEFIIAQTELLDRAKERLQKDYKSDLVPFPMLELQDEVEYLSQRQPNQVFLHDLIFADFASLSERVPFFEKIIQSPSLQVLHGSIDSLAQSHKSNQDFYYFTLVNSNVTLSNYPIDLLSRKMKHITGYVQKHTIGKKEDTKAILTREESKREFYETLKMLDGIAHNT